VRRGALPGM